MSGLVPGSRDADLDGVSSVPAFCLLHLDAYEAPDRIYG